MSFEDLTPIAYSKSALYTSLQDDDSAPLDPSKPRKTPSQVRTTAALSLFVRQLSENYHKTCNEHDARNTATRPKSMGDISSSLAQKALTLVPQGHYFASSAPAKSAKRKVAKRKRPRTNVKLADLTVNHEFLNRLNERWNFYMLQSIGGNCTNDGVALQAHFERMNQANIEWVGARVKIRACPSHPSWKDAEGILILNRTNTWVMVPQSNGKQSPMVVPKRKTELFAMVPKMRVDDGADSKEGRTEVLYVEIRS